MAPPPQGCHRQRGWLTPTWAPKGAIRCRIAIYRDVVARIELLVPSSWREVAGKHLVDHCRQLVLHRPREPLYALPEGSARLVELPNRRGLPTRQAPPPGKLRTSRCASSAGSEHRRRQAPSIGPPACPRRSTRTGRRDGPAPRIQRGRSVHRHRSGRCAGGPSHRVGLEAGFSLLQGLGALALGIGDLGRVQLLERGRELQRPSLSLWWYDFRS